MTVRMHLTEAERNLIVEMCIAATLIQRGEQEAALETYLQFTTDNWEQVRSIIFKLDQPGPDDCPREAHTAACRACNTLAPCWCTDAKHETARCADCAPDPDRPRDQRPGEFGSA